MEKECMNIVIVGHVDHGKSTLIGRLLYDTNSIPEGIFEEVKKVSEELGKETEFAYLLDSLEEERKLNITIDTTQIFFKSPKKDYVIIDAPGHKEFLKNMITGASLANAAILIIDSNDGIQEQTKRHAYILSMLGLRQVIVVVNKMDITGYNSVKFNKIKEDILKFLSKLNIRPKYIIPISAIKGDNIIKKSKNMPWYNNLSVLEALDNLNAKQTLSNQPLRFPVQDVYEINNKRILVGKIESGRLKQHDEIIFLPSNKKSEIKSIEVWNKNKTHAESGECVGVTLKEPLCIERGEVICSEVSPRITNKFEANIFWMSKNPTKINEKLILKCATQEVKYIIEKIKKKINSSTLEGIDEDCDELKETEVGNVIIKTEKPIVIENFNYIEGLGRFVLVKNDIIVSGGIIPNEVLRSY
ncbi:adenylyl-sulfate kinase [Candidatus Woesearchaeota archaeon]|jgi:sulfate adenylyltransferase large subunit|nr:adenylyl-sulfate kinase [Candidatus Woesearchaeota archaeon]